MNTVQYITQWSLVKNECIMAYLHCRTRLRSRSGYEYLSQKRVQYQLEISVQIGIQIQVCAMWICSAQYNVAIIFGFWILIGTESVSGKHK